MKNKTRVFAITALFIFLFSFPALPVFAAEDTPVEPYLHITSCPACNDDNLRAVGHYTDTFLSRPNQCNLNASAVDDSHQHEFTDEYTLYKCYSCTYEKKFDRVGTEYCPDSGDAWAWDPES